jgi:hypothetical protein
MTEAWGTTPTMPSRTTRNLILDYYDRLPGVIARCVEDVAPVKDPTAFSPGFLLPEPDAAMRDFFAVAEARWWELGEHDGGRLSLLDLTRNPGTYTTKTLASLLIVARAVEYIRRTDESVLIFSPTSGNKGTALRDAVRRAVRCGLVGAEQLRVAVLAPAACREKLRGDGPDPALNPVFLYDGDQPEDVKAIGRAFVDGYAAKLPANVWFSLELRNYLIADAARAFFERDVEPTAGARPRLHAHAVSSAFGLLGYNLGRDILETEPGADPEDRPGFLLVQHLGTPDMVINLRHGDFDRSRLPAYIVDPASGLYVQDVDPRFPKATYDPDEVLDPTFYTRAPATSPAMNALIERHGGDGIVVSLYECLQRYPQVRGLLSGTDRTPPADPRRLREWWSLTIALTGVLNAVERGIAGTDRDIVVHGSGTYARTDYPPLDLAATVPVRSAEDVARTLLAVH